MPFAESKSLNLFVALLSSANRPANVSVKVGHSFPFDRSSWGFFLKLLDAAGIAAGASTSV
jgi:hypothetical protein